MKRFYKVFLVLFVVMFAINIYAIDWQQPERLYENSNNFNFLFSAAAAFIGIIFLLMMEAWSRIGIRK